MIGVVLDTNVLVSANLNDEGLENFIVSLALNRRLQLYMSEPILEEYERVLHYSRLKFSPDKVSRLLDRLCQAGIMVKPGQIVTAAKHEEDNRFLECAEAANAAFLVTGNKRHFPKRWKDTEVVTARQLLGLIVPAFFKTKEEE